MGSDYSGHVISSLRLPNKILWMCHSVPYHDKSILTVFYIVSNLINTSQNKKGRKKNVTIKD